MKHSVYFVTNRNRTTPAKGWYGSRFHSDGAQYYRAGVASVEQEDSDDPFKASFALQDADTATERAPRGSGSDASATLGSHAMFEIVKRRMRTERRDAIVHIHGFASEFATTVERGAELAAKYFVRGRDGVERAPLPVTFSWPSNGRSVPFASYASDRHDARESGEALARALCRFADFLRAEDDEFRRLTRGERHLDAARDARDRARALERAACSQRVHLLAHSMGNYTLRAMLLRLREEFGSERLPCIFDNVFLMCADEDADALESTDKLGLLPSLCNAVHVYHSKDDQALLISDGTKLNPDRLGQNGPRDMAAVDPKVVAIDCRHVDRTSLSDGAHQYYRKREEVVADVKAVLAGRTPDQVPKRVSLVERNRYMIADPD